MSYKVKALKKIQYMTMYDKCSLVHIKNVLCDTIVSYNDLFKFCEDNNILTQDIVDKYKARMFTVTQVENAFIDHPNNPQPLINICLRFNDFTVNGLSFIDLMEQVGIY